MRQFFALMATAAMFLGVARGQDAPVVPAPAKEVSVLDQLVHEARDLFDLGRYGASEQRCRQVLAFDHHNKEALHGIGLIEQARVELVARPATQDPYLWGLVYPQIVWELPGDPGNSPAEKARTAQVAALRAKLSTILLDTVEFRSTPLREAVARLSEAAHGTDADGKDNGITIELQLPETPLAASASEPKAPPAPETGSNENLVDSTMPGVPPGAEAAPIQPPPASADTPVTLSLSNVSLTDALASVGSAVGLKTKVDPDKVLLVPCDAAMEEPLVTMAIRLPLAFIVGPDEATANETTGTNEIDARKFLESSGVTFPPGAKAIYVGRTGQLIMRNTRPNIDLTQALVTPSCCFPPSTPDATLPATNP